jgi:signal transduction histidine kinase
VARTPVELKWVNLEALTTGILRDYPGLQPPQAEIEIVRPLISVYGHEAFLTQCLSNLLGNAVKFVPPGERPRVRLWTEPLPTTVRICVKDNGIGIPAEAQNRIFGIFQRLHSQKTYEGTGIGLAIVKKAAERMGGRIGVESTPGKGSKFWLELPRDRH